MIAVDYILDRPYTGKGKVKKYYCAECKKESVYLVSIKRRRIPLCVTHRALLVEKLNNPSDWRQVQ